jgi:hypothetical protein
MIESQLSLRLSASTIRPAAAAVERRSGRTRPVLAGWLSMSHHSDKGTDLKEPPDRQ